MGYTLYLGEKAIDSDVGTTQTRLTADICSFHDHLVWVRHVGYRFYEGPSLEMRGINHFPLQGSTNSVILKISCRIWPMIQIMITIINDPWYSPE
jgi:hypothetical protein